MRPMLLVVATLCLPALAAAETLEEKKYRKQQMEYLQKESIEPLHEACATKIEVSIDWKKFSKELAEQKSASPYGYCATAPDVVRGLCGDEDAKPEVQSKVKKIVCSFGKRAAVLKGGTLSWVIDFDAANNEAFVRDYLMKNL